MFQESTFGGVDVQGDFFEVGFLMFNDRDTMKDHFIATGSAGEGHILMVRETQRWI
jgi:hypothetical protein